MSVVIPLQESTGPATTIYNPGVNGDDGLRTFAFHSAVTILPDQSSGNSEPIILQMIEPEGMDALLEQIVARRALIEHDFQVVLPNHRVSSVLDELLWLSLVHKLLWLVSLEFPLDGGWGLLEVVTAMSLEELDAELDRRAVSSRH